MADFHYEWWTVEITTTCGIYTWEFKGKSKEHVIKQIEKEVSYSKSEMNLAKDIWHRQPEILEVHWNTLVLDRIGYQRLS